MTEQPNDNTGLPVETCPKLGKFTDGQQVFDRGGLAATFGGVVGFTALALGATAILAPPVAVAIAAAGGATLVGGLGTAIIGERMDGPAERQFRVLSGLQRSGLTSCEVNAHYLSLYPDREALDTPEEFRDGLRDREVFTAIRNAALAEGNERIVDGLKNFAELEQERLAEAEKSTSTPDQNLENAAQPPRPMS